MQEAIVDTAWLGENINSPNIRVIDATWYLPNSGKTGFEDYKKEHIPGAVFWDIDSISDPYSSLPHTMPNEEVFEGHMNAIGISNHHKLIVYDNVKMMTAPRVWWMLRAFGHNNISVLDGGMIKWQAEQRPISKALPIMPKTSFSANLNRKMIRSFEQIEANLITKEEIILDARSSGRFEGSEAEPRAGCRPGHIPESLNLPFNRLIDPQKGTFLPLEKLTKEIKSTALDLEKPVITTCGSGVTACVLALALHLLEKKDVAVYDGSWSEWGSKSETPVETK